MVAGRVNGNLRDLARVLTDGNYAEPVTAMPEDGLAIIRPSCAHVMAHAVQELFPEAKLGSDRLYISVSVRFGRPTRM